MTNWISSFKRRSVARAQNYAIIHLVKCDFPLQYINHLIITCMPMFDRRRGTWRQDFFKSAKLGQSPAITEKESVIRAARVACAMITLSFGSFLTDHRHGNVLLKSFKSQ
jgi:hypothetical protein